MKKIFVKVLFVCIAILLLPFIITLLFSNNNESNENLDFQIIYETNGVAEKLDFEEYLVGVVAANMPAGYELEALKAQAVIARTYALHNISLLSSEKEHEKNFTTSELGLSYISLTDMEKFWGSDEYQTYFSKIENAVYVTKSEVLLYEDTLILPVFFDTGSGFTRNSAEAWGIDIPYLVSVPSKQDVTSTNYMKITEYAVADLIELLEYNYADLSLSEGTFFDEVTVSDRDSINYVTQINLGNQTVSGEEFAKVLGLNSNHFYFEDYEGKVRFICTGVGHGIGLSQYGANAMAEEGSSYLDILLHYYTGTNVEKSKMAD